MGVRRLHRRYSSKPASRQLGNWTEPHRDVGRGATQVCLVTFPRAKRLTILALTQQVKKLRK